MTSVFLFYQNFNKKLTNFPKSAMLPKVINHLNIINMKKIKIIFRNICERLGISKYNRIPKRYSQLNVSPQLQQKCERIKKGLKKAKKIRSGILAKRLDRICFAGYMVDNKLTSIEVGPMYLFDVSINNNLIGLKNAKHEIAPPYEELAHIKVYRESEVDAEPFLTIADVISQIPEELAEDTVAFRLSLEKDFHAYGYNLLVEAYEYNVILYER